MAVTEDARLLLGRIARHKGRRPAPPSDEHAAVVDALEDALRASGWVVEREPLVGTVRPDVVATDPTGVPYVFEVKDTAPHLGSVAQVEAYRDALAENRQLAARGVLVSDSPVPPELDTVAKRAGVSLWRVGGASTELASSLALLVDSESA